MSDPESLLAALVEIVFDLGTLGVAFFAASRYGFATGVGLYCLYLAGVTSGVLMEKRKRGDRDKAATKATASAR